MRYVIWIYLSVLDINANRSLSILYLTVLFDNSLTYYYYSCMLQFVMNCIDPVKRRRMYLKWQRNNESYRFVTFNIIISINACDVKCFFCVFLFAALFVFCKCCLIFSDLKVYFLQAVCVALLFFVIVMM